MGKYDAAIKADNPAIYLTLNDQGQMFASVPTIRAAIFDVIESEKGEWFFGDDSLSEEEQNEERSMFADRVVARIAELQKPPHDGVRLENLCDFHKARALPVRTVNGCVQCEKERNS